jgi:hypothetical protein
MPNHFFLAVLTKNQLEGSVGKKWLAILKEHGFEFVRAVSNSVGCGAKDVVEPGTFGDLSINYLFGLFRNIGVGAVTNPYQPPEAWTELPSVVPEAWRYISEEAAPGLAVESQTAQRAIWDAYPPARFYTKKEVIDAGAPVWLAGQRSKYPQQTDTAREAADRRTAQRVDTTSKAASFPTPTPVVEAVGEAKPA